jgi:transketolase
MVAILADSIVIFLYKHLTMESAPMTGNTLDRDEIVRLAALATGDEKHEASSYSTLDALHVLYGEVLQIDPADPAWEDRDRFILSKGHGPAAYYAVLCARGFFPEPWLSQFMLRGGRLGGHPDRLLVPGVEASTGSLGHGLPMAVGVALALQAKRSPRRVVVLTGDAELGNLTLLVIDNGSSSIRLRPIEAPLSAFGWRAQAVDGRDPSALAAALSQRRRLPTAVVAVVADES